MTDKNVRRRKNLLQVPMYIKRVFVVKYSDSVTNSLK